MGASATATDAQQPLSALLRAGTKAAHERAEKSTGAAWLLRGELDREEYVRFLMMLWHVYDTLERALDKHASLPALAPTYNPHLLGRKAPISADISTLLGVPEEDWLTHPIHTALLAAPPPPLSAYTTRLRALSDTRPTLLLAHAYVRYLGDLSGGQVLRRRVAKAYALDADGAGVEFYGFGSLAGARTGTAGDLLKVKVWFRDGMDAFDADLSLKHELVQEANVAFDLNTGLFTALRAPSATRPPQASILTAHPAPSPAIPPLGDPSTPHPSTPNPFASAMSSSPPATPLLSPQSKEMPIVIEHTAEPEESSYSVASVVAVVLAVGIAHFVLVTGKWVGTDGWVHNLFRDYF